MNYRIEKNLSHMIVRDLYLRDLHLGKIQGPLTGSIYYDKPWTVNYRDNEKAYFDVHNTFYTTYKNYALEHLDEAAVYVLESKKRYTHREVLELVDKAANGLNEIGIKENSMVGIMLNGSIEEVVNFLAISKLGAISKYIDYMKAVPNMKHNVEECNLDLIVMDECFLPLNPIINEKGIKVVVANAKEEHNDIMLYEELYKSKNIVKNAAEYKEGKVTLIINSSGTTGPAKPISHTDFSVNSAAQKMLFVDYPIGDGDVLIKNIPSQIGLGLVTTLYTGILSGAEVVSIGGNGTPDLSNKLNGFIKDFPAYKEKYNLRKDAKVSTFTAPVFIRLIMSDEEIKDMSYIGTIMGAGSKMDKEELDKMIEIARAKGYQGEICNAYGQNEFAGAITANSNQKNINGSAGYPVIGTNLIFVDKDTHELVEPGKIGLVFEQSDSRFKHYENLLEESLKAKTYTSDGEEWFDTKDLGYMDENGFVHITGRTTRVVTREDFKFSLDTIEAKIRALPFIKDCAIIMTETGRSWEEFVAFLIPNDVNDMDEEKMKSLIVNSGSLYPFEIPSDFILTDNIPYLNATKIDYNYFNKIYEELKGKTRVRKMEN